MIRDPAPLTDAQLWNILEPREPLGQYLARLGVYVLGIVVPWGLVIWWWVQL